MAMSWPQLLNSERRRQTTIPTDHREQFERDYDRSIFSTPVKRLQDKAQVFPLEPHDAVRTRLTHSLEVSSVARGLATRISRGLLEAGEIGPGMDRQIEAIATTCGLIHDLGNPPFGHAGEEAIQEWFRERIGEPELRKRLDGRDQLIQDFLQFEGNAQTLRLVAKLQILADENGLNLTYGTLSAACKYIAPSHEAVRGGDHARSKPGYFASENELIGEIRGRTGTGDARNPITYLVEAADDIVYSIADIEDAVKKGVLSWRDLREELDGESLGIPRGSMSKVWDRKDLILGPGGPEGDGALPGDIHASALRTAMIGVLVEAATEGFRSHYERIMQGSYGADLFSGGWAESLIEGLKKMGRQRIYCTPATLKLELAGRRIIQDLMDLFWEGASVLPVDGPPKTKTFPGKLGTLLSESYRMVFQLSLRSAGTALPEDYRRFQLVTDYVCGMTDSFAKRLHAELTNGQG